MTDLYVQCKNTTLKQGSKGQCVKYAQQKLQDWGFYKAKSDGDFGPVTKSAVIAFQNKTRHTPDGVLGPKTWSSFPTYKVVKPGVVQGDAWVLAELERKGGKINTPQDLRNIIAKYGAYLYYYNQQQTQYKTVTTLKANCADWINDVGLPVARAKGWVASGVHCEVKCLDGNWYGHYYMMANGVKCDLAAWAKGKAYGQLICGTGTIGKDYKFLHYEGNYIP